MDSVHFFLMLFHAPVSFGLFFFLNIIFRISGKKTPQKRKTYLSDYYFITLHLFVSVDVSYNIHL